MYAKLVELKEASAKRLADTTGLPRTSVYDYVLELRKKGLAVELDVNNKKVFRPDDPENLLTLLDKQLAELGSDRKILKKILPDIKKGVGGSEPRIKFYPGAEGFVAVLGDILRSGAKEALLLWPFGEMTERIGEEYLRDFTQRRVLAGMELHTVWPCFVRAKGGTSQDKPCLALPKEKIKIAPASCKWQMASIIYGDKVAFVSSRAEGFAFTVQSRDFANLQRMQFEQIWDVSKSLRARTGKDE